MHDGHSPSTFESVAPIIAPEPLLLPAIDVPPLPAEQPLTENLVNYNIDGLPAARVTDVQSTLEFTRELEGAYQAEEVLFPELVERMFNRFEADLPEMEELRIYTARRETALAELMYARFLDRIARDLKDEYDVSLVGVNRQTLRREIHSGVLNQRIIEMYSKRSTSNSLDRTESVNVKGKEMEGIREYVINESLRRRESVYRTGNVHERRDETEKVSNRQSDQSGQKVIDAIDKFKSIIKELGTNQERLTAAGTDAYRHFRLHFLGVLAEKLKVDKVILKFSAKIRKLVGLKFLEAPESARTNQGRIPDFQVPDKKFDPKPKDYTIVLPDLEDIEDQPVRKKGTLEGQISRVLEQKFGQPKGWPVGQLDMFQAILRSENRPKKLLEVTRAIVQEVAGGYGQDGRPVADGTYLLGVLRALREGAETDLERTVFSTFEYLGELYTLPNTILEDALREFTDTTKGGEILANLASNRRYLNLWLKEIGNILGTEYAKQGEASSQGEASTSRSPSGNDLTSKLDKIGSYLSYVQGTAKNYTKEQEQAFTRLVEYMNHKREEFFARGRARLINLFLYETDDLYETMRSTWGMLGQYFRHSLFQRWIASGALLLAAATFVLTMENYEVNKQNYDATHPQGTQHSENV